MEKYTVNKTYLVEFGNTLLSVTILKASKEAYYIRWNREITSTEWYRKSKFDASYILVEDITEIASTLTAVEYETCPTCGGEGSIPEVSTTAGVGTCPTCWGNKIVAKKMVFKN